MSFPKVDQMTMEEVEKTLNGLDAYKQELLAKKKELAKQILPQTWAEFKEHLEPVMQELDITDSQAVTDYLSRVKLHTLAPRPLYIGSLKQCKIFLDSTQGKLNYLEGHHFTGWAIPTTVFEPDWDVILEQPCPECGQHLGNDCSCGYEVEYNRYDRLGYMMENYGSVDFPRQDRVYIVFQIYKHEAYC